MTEKPQIDGDHRKVYVPPPAGTQPLGATASTATGGAGVGPQRLPDFLVGGGELGELIRSHDCTATPLGPPAAWPQSLRIAMRIMLTSRQPIWIGWGPELNDNSTNLHRNSISSAGSTTGAGSARDRMR